MVGTLSMVPQAVVASSLPWQLAIRFAPPIALWDWSGRRFTGERPVGVWIGCQRTLKEAVEEQPAVA